MLHKVCVPTEQLDGLHLCRDAIGQLKDVLYEILYSVHMLSDWLKDKSLAKL